MFLNGLQLTLNPTTGQLQIQSKAYGTMYVYLRDKYGNVGRVRVVVPKIIEKKEEKGVEANIDKELNKELGDILKELGIGIEDTDGLETNEALSGLFYYWKQSRLLKKYKGTNFYKSIKSFGTKLKTYDDNKLIKLLKAVEYLKTLDRFKSEKYQNILEIIRVTIRLEQENRDTKLDIEESELRKELFIEYPKIGLDGFLDMSGLKSTGKGLGGVTAYWVGYIKNDPYLMQVAGEELNKSLGEVSSELNPGKKFKKLVKLGERVRELKKVGKVLSGVQKLKTLRGKTFLEAKKLLEKNGFKYNGKTPGGYDKFKNIDGSEIQIRPNGEVVRTNRIWKIDGSGKFPQRYDEFGKPTSSHNTGEFIIR